MSSSADRMVPSRCFSQTALVILMTATATCCAAADAPATRASAGKPQEFLEPVRDPRVAPGGNFQDELFLSKTSGAETDPVLRVLGDYPSTKASLGRRMGDRTDPNFRDPAGKVVAFEVLKNGDVLFGPNLGVARRRDSDGPGARLETDPQHSAPIDFYWDARDRKLHVRSILLTENGDPADLAFRRAGDETYPYGPPMAVPRDTNLGTMYWMGWAAKDHGFDRRVAQIYAKSAEDLTDKSTGGTILFATTPIGTTKPLDRVVINSDGNVGVGTPAPQAKLHVAGDGVVAGVAEDYAATERLEAGDVVVIDDTAKSLSVRRASRPYDQRLIGVVGEKPGLRIGHVKDGYPVSHAGRSRVRVSTENGPIRAGDYLTSSSSAGVAMKATSKGAVVGKALEPFSATGEGRIYIMLNLTWYDP